MTNSDWKKKQISFVIPEHLGIMPPQAIDLEETVLGAIMLEKNNINDVIDVLKVDSFYKDGHAKIYEAILQLFRKSEPIDLMTVTAQLRKNGTLETAGGAYSIAELTTKVNSSANIQHHSRIILEQAMRRDLIRIASNTRDMAYDQTIDVFESVGKSEMDISNIVDQNTRGSYVSYMDISQQAINEINRNKNKEITGVRSGFPSVDRVTGGWQNSDLIIIAGRPGMAKTGFAGSVVTNAAKDFGVPCGFFTLEMSSIQIANRMISSDLMIPLEDIRRPRQLSQGHLLSINENASQDYPIFIDDTPALSIVEFKAKARRMKQKHDIGLIVVDYIQLMEGDQGGGREQEVGSISRALKSVAKELNIPIIALSQLSRAVETRGGDKKPQLSDLRESGCLSVESSLIYTKKGVQNNPTSRLNLLSLNTNKIVEMDSKNIPRQPREVFRLKLQSGRFIDCTSNHPILTTEGYIELKDLQKTDSIACAVNFGGGDNYISESRFIGWMLGNGCMYGYNVPSFITNDPEIANDFTNFINLKFGFLPKDHPHYKSKVFQYDVTNSSTGNRTKEGNTVTKWLKENDLWGNKAKDKHIPEWFMSAANDKSVCELLQGLWETDGSIALGKKRHVISYSTTSVELANQIIYLLARIGIFSHLDGGYWSTKATTPCYKIIIANYDFQKVFIKKVPLRGSKGSKLISIAKRNNSSKYTNKISRSSTEKIELICRGFNPLKRIQLHDGRRMTKSHLSDVINDFNNRGIDVLKQYDWVLSDNIVWDNIDSIESIGVKDIFDRHVPETNNFIVNGIIVHNSLEQDADMVIFLYRPHYYGIVGSNGESLEFEGNVIIAKHRNGTCDEIPIKFLGKYTKWYDDSHTGGYSASDFPNADRPCEF